MGKFSIFSKKKPFFTAEENDRIIQAICEAERQTSGEIRLFVESKCKYVDPIDRAAEVFYQLKMENTELRNGVIFYVATKDKQLAIYADKGIHEATGTEHWKSVVQEILAVFGRDEVVAGIIKTIKLIGKALKYHFPYNGEVDKNELPDEIIFGS